MHRFACSAQNWATAPVLPPFWAYAMLVPAANNNADAARIDVMVLEVDLSGLIVSIIRIVNATANVVLMALILLWVWWEG